MKSQHNLLVIFHECLVVSINSGYFQGYRASMAHQAQSLVPGTGNGPHGHVLFRFFSSILLCTQYIHITTAQLNPSASNHHRPLDLEWLLGRLQRLCPPPQGDQGYGRIRPANPFSVPGPGCSQRIGIVEMQ